MQMLVGIITVELFAMIVYAMTVSGVIFQMVLS